MLLQLEGWSDPSDDEIDAEADRLIRAGSVIIPDNHPKLAGPGVVHSMYWVDDDSAVDDDRLAAMLDYWRLLARRSGSGRVTAAAVDVIELRSALGYILMLDVVRDGYDATYRVYGTEVARPSGRDWTGHAVSEMSRVTHTPATMLYRASYLAVFRTLRPMYTAHVSAPHQETTGWKRLVLPLCDDDGRCIRFMVGNIPVEPRFLSREALEERQGMLYRDGG